MKRKMYEKKLCKMCLTEYESCTYGSLKICPPCAMEKRQATLPARSAAVKAAARRGGQAKANRALKEKVL